MTKPTLNPEIPRDDQRQDRFQGEKSAQNRCSQDLTPLTRGNPHPDGDRSGNGPQSAPFDPLAHCPPGNRSRYEVTARAAMEGSYPKAVKLKCLDCSGWEYVEARDCTIHQCALWLLNRRIFTRNGRNAS